jgi:hypothetical protein
MTAGTQWAKWTRKWHRWISTPMLLLIPVTLGLKFTGHGNVLKEYPIAESLQSILFLLLTLTGGYMYIYRLVNKKKRAARIPASVSKSRA